MLQQNAVRSLWGPVSQESQSPPSAAILTSSGVQATSAKGPNLQIQTPSFLMLLELLKIVIMHQITNQIRTLECVSRMFKTGKCSQARLSCAKGCIVTPVILGIGIKVQGQGQQKFQPHALHSSFLFITWYWCFCIQWPPAFPLMQQNFVLLLLRLGYHSCIFKIYAILTFVDVEHEKRISATFLEPKKLQDLEEIFKCERAGAWRTHMSPMKAPQGKHFQIRETGTKALFSRMLFGILPANVYWGLWEHSWRRIWRNQID